MEELEEPSNKSQKPYSFKSTLWESVRVGKYPKRVLAHFKKPHITQNPRQFLLGKPRAEKSASSLRNFALFILIEPPYTEPYVRWCERSGVNHSLLLDYVLDSIIKGFYYKCWGFRTMRKKKSTTSPILLYLSCL